MILTSAIAIKKIKDDGRFTVSGCKGLQLRVEKGIKKFFLRYSVNGQRKTISLGSADSLSLADARALANDLLKRIALGEDPAEEKRLARKKAAEEKKRKQLTFSDAATQWVAERKAGNYWRYNSKGESNTLSRLYNHVLPHIGEMKIDEIEPEHIRDMLLPIWNRSPSTSSKVLADVRAVFRWSIALRLRQNRENPADWNGALGVLMEPYEKTRKEEENFSGLDFHEIPHFVQEISALHSRSSEMLLLSIFLAARSKAIRNAKWDDFDLEKRIWNIPLEDDKAKDLNRERTIYLNSAAVSLLKEVPRFSESPYVFCNAYGKPYSDMAMNQVIRKAHARRKMIDQTGWIDREKSSRTGKECIVTQHGTARSAFRTWAKDDELGNNKKFDQEAVERCLLHDRADPYKGAYDRSKMEHERRRIMEEWGEFCCSFLPKK